MLCWSASFYPQPIYNYARGSMSGLSIDFPTINFLGFSWYTIYTSAFLYSPVIRQQYAARFPNSSEPTVRFNDLAFALHAVVLSAIVYSQFWPSIWGLRVLRTQRISKTMLGLFWGSIIAPLIIVWMVVARSPDGGLDPASWAWIDVVSSPSPQNLVHLSLTGGMSICPDLFIFVCQTAHHGGEICPPSLGELQA